MERMLGTHPAIGVELRRARVEVEREVGTCAGFVRQLEVRPGVDVPNELREDRVVVARVRAAQPCGRGERGQRRSEAQRSSPGARL